MSVYIIPDSTVNEIERMLNSFWWGGGNNNKGIRWLAWERMTGSKSEGGLGFRNFKAFNMAMVAKQGWHIMMNQNTLVARIFKARYFPNSSFFEAKLGNNPSYVWRSLWKSRHILTLGCRWRIGDGSQIKVMLDPWLRNEGKGWMHSPQSQGVYNLFVKDLMMNNDKKWLTHKIMQLFSHAAAEEILKVPLMSEVSDDCLVWTEEQNGEYSVRTGYKLLMREREDGRRHGTRESWSSLWKIRAPPKAKHLLWRICRDCLPTTVRLRQHYVPCTSICQLCEEEVEDEWHVLFGCTASSQSWTAAGLSSIINSRLLEFTDVKNLIHDICSKENKELAGRFAVMVWSLWNNRNNWIWNNEKSEAS
jgi:hypothetical protein